ncbi:hypothetical protein RHSIM_Rhsim02G0035800 [Rhododendron simsii]|uniref:Uncharacterized protein n=1 Tax=Rhododendron simsii TaxID=118357 RepID=A0A834LSC5_RHOSS|nr:hypothetical protein RHSIM_Rhsim02G0035800 [Rhododendron simsii]
MDVRYSYCCRHDDSIVPEKKKGQYDGFFVDLRMCHKLRKLADHGDSDAHDNEVKLGTVCSVFTVNRSEFLAGVKLKYLMYTCLPLAYVPDDSVKDSILPGESEDEGIARAMTEMDVWNYAPATKASIGALEEVAFDGLWPVKECKQRSKILAVGKLARMLCSHVFHRQLLNVVDLMGTCAMRVAEHQEKSKNNSMVFHSTILVRQQEPTNIAFTLVEVQADVQYAHQIRHDIVVNW